MDLIKKDKLVSLLNKVLNQVGKQTSEDEIIFICPFHRALHNIDRKKFGISLNDGYYNCFACGESGKSFRTLFKKLKVNKSFYKQLYSIIGSEFNPNFGKPKPEKHNIVDLKLPNEFLSMALPNKSCEYRHALSYLKKRNITRDDILRYNIGYCESGLYRNRIIIPSYDKDGNLNFFAARDFLDNSYYKYLLPDWSKDIIGFELFINFNEPVTLVEGTFDAVSIRRNAIPLFGKMLSDTLIQELLISDVPKVNVCLDDDAIKNSIKISNYLTNQGIDVSLIKLKEKDPSLIGFNGINEIINKSKTFDFTELMKLKLQNI